MPTRIQEEKNAQNESLRPVTEKQVKEAANARSADRRNQHQQRSMVVRVLAVVGGFLLSIAGLFFVLWLPELGIPLLLGGLRLLSLEYEWAGRALSWVEWRWKQLQDWFSKQTPTIKIGLPIVLLGLLVWLAWWYF